MSILRFPDKLYSTPGTNLLSCIKRLAALIKFAIMTHPTEEPRSVFYQAFTRDGAKCVYCDRDILESFETFSASHLDHLKPKKNRGPDNDPWNRVTSCGVCNNLKRDFEPSEGEFVTEATFAACIARARSHIQDKRLGITDTSYLRDYNDWRKELHRDGG